MHVVEHIQLHCTVSHAHKEEQCSTGLLHGRAFHWCPYVLEGVAFHYSNMPVTSCTTLFSVSSASVQRYQGHWSSKLSVQHAQRRRHTHPCTRRRSPSHSHCFCGKSIQPYYKPHYLPPPSVGRLYKKQFPILLQVSGKLSITSVLHNTFPHATLRATAGYHTLCEPPQGPSLQQTLVRATLSVARLPLRLWQVLNPA